MDKYIYALYPLDKPGNATAVYIGCSMDPAKRVKEHLYNKTPSCGSVNLSKLMREHGYAYQVLDTVKESEAYIEYDYIDFFLKLTNIEVLNTKIGNHADYRRVILRMVSQFEFRGERYD